jgi:hypothetical protein
MDTTTLTARQRQMMQGWEPNAQRAHLERRNVHHFDPLRGTLICENGTSLLYWSPDRWNDPNTALRMRIGMWRYVDDALRTIFVSHYGGGVIPQHPGQYVLLEEWPTVNKLPRRDATIAKAREVE